MKIKFRKTVVEEIEMDVKFPIYRKSPPDENQPWYYKITEDLVEISINFYDNEVFNSKGFNLDVDTNVEFGGDEEYEFGLGKYACTEQEFNDAYKKAMSMLPEN
jgi:hypothetical protein